MPCVRRNTCTELGYSMHVMKRDGSTLLPMISTAVPTPMTRIRTGSKTFTGPTLFMPLVGWLVASFAATTLILINVRLSVEE